MAYAFDTLGYARRLRDAGVASEQAEAHAEAARAFIMTEVATKSDLEAWGRWVESKFENFELRMDNRFAQVDARFVELESRLEARFSAIESRFDSRFSQMDNRISTLELRLMVRVGGMLAVAVAILAAIIKL